MSLPEQYNNLLKEYRQEIINGNLQEKQYLDFIEYHNDLTQKLTKKIQHLMEDNLALRGLDRYMRL